MRSAALVILSSTLIAAADPSLADAARGASERSGASVVAIKVTQTMRWGGGNNGGAEQSRSFTTEAQGTVIDASGLVAVPLEGVRSFGGFGGMRGRGQGGGNNAPDPAAEPPAPQLAIVTGDNQEVAATIVLRDAETDLAVLKPTGAWPGAAPVALAADAKAALQVTDVVFALQRCGRSAKRVVAVQVGRITAAIPGETGAWLVDRDLAPFAGCPLFTASGAPLGLLSAQRPEADAGAGGAMRGRGAFGGPGAEAPVIVIRTGAALAALAEKARNAKPEAPAGGDKPAAAPEAGKSF